MGNYGRNFLIYGAINLAMHVYYTSVVLPLLSKLMSKTSLPVHPQLFSVSDNIGLPCCGLDAPGCEGHMKSTDSYQSLSPGKCDGQTRALHRKE